MKRATIHKIKKAGYTYWRVIIPALMRKPGDGRERFFKVKEDAIAYADSLNSQTGTGPTPLLSLNTMAQGRVRRCIDQLGGDLDKLDQAVTEYLTRHPASGKGMTLSAVAGEVVEAKRKANRREVYVAQMEDVFNMFIRGRETKLIGDVTPDEVSGWLHQEGLSDWTRLGYLGRLKTLFGHALKHGYILKSPLAAVERPLVEDTDIVVMPTDMGKALLHAAILEDREVALHFALQMFGYLRPTEALRVECSGLSSKFITVQGRKSKTRSRRLIPICETLRKWIEACPVKKPLSVLTKGQIRVRVNRIRLAAGAAWSHDILRHTCVSASCVIHGAMKTSEWAGHSEAMLFRHYRALLTEDQAKAWFGINPESCRSAACDIPTRTSQPPSGHQSWRSP